MTTLNWFDSAIDPNPRARESGNFQSALHWIKSEISREPGRVIFWALVCLLANAFMFGWLQ